MIGFHTLEYTTCDAAQNRSTAMLGSPSHDMHMHMHMYMCMSRHKCAVYWR